MVFFPEATDDPRLPLGSDRRKNNGPARIGEPISPATGVRSFRLTIGGTRHCSVLRAPALLRELYSLLVARSSLTCSRHATGAVAVPPHKGLAGLVMGLDVAE
jgi:hypothetical protein